MYSLASSSLAARKRKAKKEEIKDKEEGTNNNGTDEQKEDGTGSSSSSSSSSPSPPSSSSSPPSDHKTTAALLRIQKDLADLEVPEDVDLIKHSDMALSFVLRIQQGYWKGGIYEFRFTFPDKYPFVGPKVVCVDQIYHPNIDLEGGVCVNVLRPWKPTYSTQMILFGLLFLFTHPNPNDPLNQDAAKEMRENPTNFARNVVNAMKGMRVGNITFPKNRGMQ